MDHSKKATGIVSSVISEVKAKKFEGANLNFNPDYSVDSTHDEGGHLLKNVEVICCFWGPYWTFNNPPPNPSAADYINAFFGILTGPFMNRLPQYRDIGKGSLIYTDINDTTIPVDKYSNQDVEDMLVSRFTKTAMPQPADDTDRFYAVILPPNIQNILFYTMPGQPVGQHGSFDYKGQKAYYAWINNTGSLTGGICTTKVFSHELIEACTDPDVDNDNGYGILVDGTNADGTLVQNDEIGDTCNNQFSIVNVNGINCEVQSYWSKVDNECILPQNPLANAKGNPFSIMDKWGTMHLLYRDENDQISDIYFQENKGWKYMGLSGNVDGSILANGDLFSIMDKWETFHVLYRDANNLVSDIYYQEGKGWQYANLSTAGSPAANGDLFSLMDKWDTFHILYRDVNNLVSDIYYQDGSGWQYANLSTAGSPALNGDLVALMDKWDTFHILYRDVNNQVSDIYYQDGKGWQYANLSTFNSLAVNGDLFALMDKWDTFHILYRDVNNQVSDIYYQDGKGWQYANLSTADSPAVNGDLFALMDKWDTFHILYRDGNDQVSDIYYQDGKGWQYTNLNNSTKDVISAPPVIGNPFSFIDEWDVMRVLYKDNNQHISDIYYINDKGWAYETNF